MVKGSAGSGWSDIGTLFESMIRTATKRLRLTTAYFVPDDRYAAALIDAIDRGVEIEVLVPGPHADKRFVQVAGEAAYEPLLDAGVRISCFQPSMLHAKVLTADSMVATIGSSNFNHRSLSLDDEANVVVFDPAVAAVLDRHFDEDLARSEPLDPSRWRKRSMPQKALEKLTTVLDDHL